MGVESQARAMSEENRSYSIMTPGIQQLQQADFGPDQIRALGEFVQGLIDRTVQPIVERLDQRHEQVERRLAQADQRLEQGRQRLEQIDQKLEQDRKRFDRIDQKLEQDRKRFDRIDQKLEQGRKRFDRIDQRLEKVDQRLEQANERFEHVDRQFVHVDRQFAMISSQLENLQESVRGLLRWSWMPYLVMGLAFAGLYFALFGIWLAMVRNAA